MSNGALDTQIGGNHYKRYAIQPVEFIYRNNLDFLTGNCIKCLQLGAFLQSFIKLSEKNTR